MVVAKEQVFRVAEGKIGTRSHANQDPEKGKVSDVVKGKTESEESVNVNGFPNSLRVCFDILHAGGQAIISHYIAEAKTGNLDESNNIILSQVLTPKPELIDLQGRALK